MIQKDLTLYRGDDFTLEIAVLNADGTPADLTNSKVELAFGDSNYDDLRYATIALSNNVVIAIFTHAQTKDIDWSNGVWDLQVTKDGKVTTIAKGKLKITRDVTP